MNDKKPFSFKDRIKSFGFAFDGLKSFFLNGHNVWIQLTFAILVIIAGKWYNIGSIEWCLLFLSIGLVLSAEAFNSAIELLTDMVSPGFDERAKKVKDIAAGAVLITAIMTALIGLIIFIPKIFN